MIDTDELGLGPVEYREDPRVDGGWVANIAGIVKIAREGGTEKAQAFYAAFKAEWLRFPHLAKRDREALAFDAALTAVGARQAPDPKQLH